MVDFTILGGNFIKIVDIIFLILFFIYSLLTVRQVSIMNHSVVTRAAFFIQILAWVQLALGVLVAVVILMAL